jgi:hypothetical protein
MTTQLSLYYFTGYWSLFWVEASGSDYRYHEKKVTTTTYPLLLFITPYTA